MARPAAPRRDDPVDGGMLALVFLVVVVAIAVVFPLAAVAWMAVWGERSSGEAGALEAAGLSAFPVGLIGRTVLWAGAIALLSTALAWPVAWALHGARRAMWAWLLVPMLVPNYLAYAGWGLLRAPRTFLGDLLERAAQEGHRWAPVAAGQALAVAGLALWSVPLGALVLWAGLRRLDASVLESLRLDPAPPARRVATLLTMARPAIGAAAGTVFLLMLGSAVPLHLAQIPTFAIQVWLALDTTPAGQQWRVWLLAWPLVLAAALAGWLIGSRVTSADHGAASGGAARRSSAAMIGAAVVWGAAVLVPLALFAGGLGDGRALARFWRLSGEGARASGGIAMWVGVLAVLLTAAVTLGLGGDRAGPRARVTRWCVRLLLIAGLIPGVLMGSAVSAGAQVAARAAPLAAALADSPAIVVAAHIARFGFVPALVACWLVRGEEPAQRWLRRLDGAHGLRGWMSALLPVQAGGLVGAGLATAALSLHEIESAVIVSPPGDSLARQILGYLHYLRTEEMCAAAIWTIGLGLILGGLAAFLAGLSERPPGPQKGPPAPSPTTPSGPLL